MNDRANAKAISGRIDNLRITTSDVKDLCIKDNSLAAFSCMHALYAFSRTKDGTFKNVQLVKTRRIWGDLRPWTYW